MQLTPDLAGERKDYDPWANIYDPSQLGRWHRKDYTYDVYLPERLKAAQEYHTFSQPNSLQDEFGRVLSNSLDLTFFTTHRNPAYKLVHNTAVLES